MGLSWPRRPIFSQRQQARDDSFQWHNGPWGELLVGWPHLWNDWVEPSYWAWSLLYGRSWDGGRDHDSYWRFQRRWMEQYHAGLSRDCACGLTAALRAEHVQEHVRWHLGHRSMGQSFHRQVKAYCHSVEALRLQSLSGRHWTRPTQNWLQRWRVLQSWWGRCHSSHRAYWSNSLI